MLLGTAFVVANVQGATVPSGPAPSDGVPYVRLYDHPENALEVIVNQGDGQAFAALAQDPTLSRPEVFRGGAPEAAYRAQRPLLGWLAGLSSLGQADLVPAALVGWAVLGFALLGASATLLAVERGREPRYAALVLLLPGALITLDWTGPEALGLAAALVGLVTWRRADPPLLLTGLLFTLAGLSRETLLLIPLVLLARELTTSTRSPRRLAALAVAPVTLAAWIVLVHARLDAWPTDARQDRLSAPFVGLSDAVGGWGAVDAAFAAVAVVLVVAVLMRRPRSDEALIVAAHAVFALCLGAAVWARVEDFGRVLLPLYALAILGLLPARAGQCAPTEANMRS